MIMASHAHRAWQLRSWDGFQIPLPGSRIDVGYGEIPASALEGSTVDEGCRKLRDELLKLGGAAQEEPFRPFGRLSLAMTTSASSSRTPGRA